MKPRWTLISILLFGVAMMALLIARRPQAAARTASGNPLPAVVRPAVTESSTPEVPDQLSEPGAPQKSTQVHRPEVKSVSGATPIATSEVPEIGPGLTPTVVLENLRLVFRNYCARFGGNPVGTNPEITRALDGGNPGHVEFLNPKDGMRLDNKGELVDNWGTPFFFHQLSGTEMEIHSAGPDRKMWTPDDLVIK